MSFKLHRPGRFPARHRPLPIAGWFISENPLKMDDDLGVPPCQESFIFFCEIVIILCLSDSEWH